MWWTKSLHIRKILFHRQFSLVLSRWRFLIQQPHAIFDLPFFVIQMPVMSLIFGITHPKSCAYFGNHSGQATTHHAPSNIRGGWCGGHSGYFVGSGIHSCHGLFGRRGLLVVVENMSRRKSASSSFLMCVCRMSFLWRHETGARHNRLAGSSLHRK